MRLVSRTYKQILTVNTKKANNPSDFFFLMDKSWIDISPEKTDKWPKVYAKVLNIPGSSAHGIFQARVPECGAIAFSDPIHKRDK